MNSTVEICRLCLERICGNGFDAMDDIAEKMLETLLLTLDLNLIEKPVMCKKCAVNLDKFVNFKSICLNTNSLRKIKSEKDNDVHDDHICQFCVRDTKIECCTYLNETKNIVSIVDVIEKHIPELKFNLTQEVITCTSCLEALQSMPTFIMKCLDVEGKIKKYAESLDDVSGQISLYDIQQLYSKPIIKCEDRCGEQNSYKSLYSKGGDIDVKTEIKNEEFEEVGNLDFTIKNEEIDIKQESSESERFQEPSAVTKVDKESLDVLVPLLQKKCIKQDGLAYNNYKAITMYKFRCDECPQETNHKQCLDRHKLMHKSTLEVITFKCNLCPYTAKRRDHLKVHELKHKSSSEIRMFKCELCLYQTKRNDHLQIHKLTHKTASEIKMYKCELCSYETKLQGHLKRHQFTHKSASELRMYKCEICPFETKYLNALKQHKLIHKTSLELTLYTCEMCSFETKYKHSLAAHTLTHKSSSEITMFSVNYVHLKQNTGEVLQFTNRPIKKSRRLQCLNVICREQT